MKKLLVIIAVALVAMVMIFILLSGDSQQNQKQPEGVSPAAPQAAAMPERPALQAVEVTETMVANCVHETLALPENAAFAASPRTQAVGASLKLAPCAGGTTVELRPVSRVGNGTVHDSAWRSVEDALSHQAERVATEVRLYESTVRLAEITQELIEQIDALEEQQQDSFSLSSFFVGVCVTGMLCLLAYTVFVMRKQDKGRVSSRSGRSHEQIGPGREVSPRQAPAFQDDEALPGDSCAYGQSEDPDPGPP